MYTGPNIVRDGLVFGYDADDRSTRFYPGEPTTNLFDSYVDFNLWSKIGVTVSNSSMLLPDRVNTALIWACTNPANHQLYKAHNSSSVMRTFSAYVKKIGHSGCYLAGYNNGYVAYFDLDTGTVSKTIGSGVTATIKLIGDGWYRIAIYLPSLAVEAQIGFLDAVYIGTTGYPWGISTVAGTSGYVWGAQIEANTHATQFTSTSRSTTQGLLDLTKTNTIDLSNISFDSNGDLYFNKSGDVITSPSSTSYAFGTGDFTLEVMIKPTSFSTYTHMIALPSQNIFALKANVTDGKIYFYTPSYNTFDTINNWNLTLNEWNHIIFKRESQVAYAYKNGILIGSKSSFTNNFSAQILNIGNGWANEYSNKKNIHCKNIQQSFNTIRNNTEF